MGTVPTMRDVAELAGVSPMTVSRTLRGEPTVDPQLAARVAAAVEQLGYRRNEWARGLRAGTRSGLVGLVVTNLANPFYAELATGVEEVASREGLQLLFGASGDDGGMERRAVDGLVSRRVEGLVMVPSSDDGEYLATLSAQLPTVLVTSRARSQAVDSVTVDDFGGARDASRRLVLEGHERIAFLGLPHPSQTGAERERGFVEGLRECGQEPVSELMVALAVNESEADKQMWQLMSGADRPTAVFTANNRNTIAACRWVAASDCRLRIIGFDAIRTARLFGMPVSLVEYSPGELGARAGELLLQRIDGNSAEPRHDVLATHLVHYRGHPG